MSIFGTYHWHRTVRPRILARDNYRCQNKIPGVCVNLNGDQMSHAKLEVDHIIPRVEGGRDSDENLRASCKPCNRYRAGRASGDSYQPKWREF